MDNHIEFVLKTQRGFSVIYTHFARQALILCMYICKWASKGITIETMTSESYTPVVSF